MAFGSLLFLLVVVVHGCQVADVDISCVQVGFGVTIQPSTNLTGPLAHVTRCEFDSSISNFVVAIPTSTSRLRSPFRFRCVVALLVVHMHA